MWPRSVGAVWSLVASFALRMPLRALLSQRVNDVAVGIRITPYPPHRSGRADFPHPALASGDDAQTARWIRVADMGRRKPATDEPLHSLPLHAPFLASPFESAVPEVTDREAEVGQSIPIPRNSEVSEMPAHNGFQPLCMVRRMNARGH